MIRERKQTLKISLLFLDALAGFLAFWSAFILHFYVISPERREFVMTDGLFAPAQFFVGSPELQMLLAYLPLALMFVMAQVVVFLAVDLYRPLQGRQSLRENLAIVRAVAIALVIVLAALFFYRGQSYSRLMIGYATVLSVLYIVAGHGLFRAALSYLRGRGYNIRNILLVGTGKNALRFIQSMEQYPLYGYRIRGALGPKAKMPKEMASYRIGDLKELEAICEDEQIDSVVVALEGASKELRSVVDFCYREGIDCRIIPDLFDLVTHRARVEDMNGLPVLTLRDIPLHNGYHRFMKRLFDIVFSSVVLILNLPLFVVLALIVKLSSPGPVFFVQERVGLDRRLFKLIKFRTMTVQEKNRSDTTWGSKNDVRVTPIGKFLRKTSLDELPQFLNVFLGDMSVVGPRPERPHFVKQFKNTYERYMLRHSAKAGITGWAQILGYRGDTSIEKRIEADIYYIENWSLLFDVLIVLRTIPSMIKNPGE